MTAAAGRLERVGLVRVAEVARDLDRASRAAAVAAARQRRHRERLRAGRIPLTVEVSDRTVEAMLAVGMVSEVESRRRSDLARAISEALDEWATRALATSVTP